MGTAHLLEAVRAVPGVRAVINVTTDKCYENREWHCGYRENEPLGGRDPYSSSKACSELVTAAYRASFFPPAEHARHGVAVASARAGNVIGGGDWAKDRLVPDIVAALIDGSPARIRHPQAIRPWQHVMEPHAGYLILAQRLVGEGPAFAEAWNFGPPDTETKPVAWIADRLIQKWGGGGSWVQDGGSHPHEATYLKLDISKARARLGWQPRLSLDQTLGWLADWYRAWAAGVPMRAFTEGQIEAYTTLSASIS
jgi:CDP-glucose 4,6-dehydratase